VGGAQDVGTSDGKISPWTTRQMGDGGDVAADPTRYSNFIRGTFTYNYSIRYTSGTSLIGFQRQRFDRNNNPIGNAISLTGTAGLNPQNLTPFQLNNEDPARIIIGAFNDIYEALDQGSTPVSLGAALQINGLACHAIAYGASDDENALYVGGGPVAAPPRPPPHTEPSMDEEWRGSSSSERYISGDVACLWHRC
jgi:hypothetical protein